MNLAFLSIGSNIDPEENLKSAVWELARIGRIQAVSSVWETEPVGFSNQPRFLNAVLALETRLSLTDLITDEISRIELALGRVREENKYGPRPIDIDLILFNDFVGEYEGRQLPSPEITSRAFVGIPLAEIAGDRLHPALGVPFTEIAASFVVKPGEMVLRPEFEVLVLD